MPRSTEQTEAPPPTEQSPLLRQNGTVRPSKSQVTIADTADADGDDDEEGILGARQPGVIGKGREVEVYHPGKSSFSQTVRPGRLNTGKNRG